MRSSAKNIASVIINLIAIGIVKKVLGAFKPAQRNGMSDADARAYSEPTAEDNAYQEKRRQRMKKPVTGEDRVNIGLNAAAYMRWVEVRKGAPPPEQATQRFIKGFLDADGFAYATDELKRIEISALAYDIGTVDAFIKENRFFEFLDQRSRMGPQPRSRLIT